MSAYDDPVAWVRRVAWNLAVSRWRRTRTALGFAVRQQDAPPTDTVRDRQAAAAAAVPPVGELAVVVRTPPGLSAPDSAATRTPEAFRATGRGPSR